jgi:regulator of nucleoside diphosphate kinase
MDDFGDNNMTMESMAAEARHLTPRITLSRDDYERLAALVQAATTSAPDLAELLAGEIARAHVLAAGKCPQDVVSMNSEVEFRDDRTGRVQSMRLSIPPNRMSRRAGCPCSRRSARR